MRFDMADVKPSVVSLLTVTVMAVIGISILKYVTQKWHIPGLSDLVASV